VLPGLVDETEAILRFVASELGPDTYVNLMAQYRPAARVGSNDGYAELDRRVHHEEFRRALAAAEELGLCRLDQRSRWEAEQLPQTGRRQPS